MDADTQAPAAGGAGTGGRERGELTFVFNKYALQLAALQHLVDIRSSRNARTAFPTDFYGADPARLRSVRFNDNRIAELGAEVLRPLTALVEVQQCAREVGERRVRARKRR